MELGETEKLQRGNTEFTLQSRWDRLLKLGETDFGNGHTEGWSGKLGGTDSLISVRLKHYGKETERLHCNLGGTDRSSL